MRFITGTLKNNPVESSTLLLPHFCNYFSRQTLQFLLMGAQEYFLPQGAGYPSYVTDPQINVFVNIKSHYDRLINVDKSTM